MYEIEKMNAQYFDSQAKLIQQVNNSDFRSLKTTRRSYS